MGRASNCSVIPQNQEKVKGMDGGGFFLLGNCSAIAPTKFSPFSWPLCVGAHYSQIDYQQNAVEFAHPATLHGKNGMTSFKVA